MENFYGEGNCPKYISIYNKIKQVYQKEKSHCFIRLEIFMNSMELKMKTLQEKEISGNLERILVYQLFSKI